MSEQIKRTDIAEEGVLDNLIKPLSDLKKILSETDQGLKSFAETVEGKLNFGQKAKELREFAAAEKDVNEIYKEKRSVQSETMKADNEIAKLKEKLAALTSQEAKEVANLKAEIAAQNRELQANARATQTQTEAYSRLVKETRDAKNESKELGAQLRELEKTGKSNTEAYEQLSNKYQQTTERAAQLDKELKGLDKSVGDNFRNVGNYESALEELNKTVAAGGMGYRELRKAIKEYQDIATKAGKTTPVGQQAIKDAAKLKDELDSIQAQTKVLASDGSNMKAALQLGTTVTQGYQGLLSVQQLLGVENEKVLQLMAKIQATQGILNSLNAIRNALDKDSELIVKAKLISQKAYNWVLRTTSTATGQATIATKALNVAMRALPIMAVIGGITALVGWFSKTSEEIDESTDSLKQFKEEGDLTEIISNVERLQQGFQGIKNEIKDLQNLTNLNRISSRKSFNEQLKLAREVITETETQTKALFGQSTSIDEVRNALRVASRAQAGYKLTLEELTTGQDIFKDSTGKISQEYIKTARILVDQHDEASNLIFDINKKLKASQKESEKQTEEQVKLSVQQQKILEKTKLDLLKTTTDSNDAILQLEESFIRENKKLELELLQQGVSGDEFQKRMRQQEIETLQMRIAIRKKFNQDYLDLEIELEKLLANQLGKTQNSILITADQISSAIVDIYNTATDNALASLKRLEDGYKRMYGTFEKLAAEGNITAQQSLAEMINRQEEAQRRQMQMERRKLRMQQAQQVSSILLNQLEQGKSPGEALAAAGAFLATSGTLLASLPSFDVGTENTSGGGRGVDGKGGFLAINHPDERIMTAEQNKKVGALSNPMLADIAYKYRTGQLNDNAGNSYDLIRLEGKLTAIEQAIQNQPQQVVGLEETLSGMVEMMVKNIKGNHTKTTIYKS